MRLFTKKFLLENISLRQTIIKNTFWLVFAEVITGLLRLAVVILAARALGVEEYGKFTFALSFVSLLVIFSDFGLYSIITREFSRYKEKENEFSAILAMSIILNVFALILMVLGSFFITSDISVRKTILFLSFFIIISGLFQLFYSFLRARLQMEYEAGIKIAQIIIVVAISVGIIFYAPSAVNLGIGYLVSNAVVLVLFLLLFNFRFQRIKIKWDKNIFYLLKISWPLTFGFMSSWIYMTITSVMLGYLNLIVESGWYNAASKIAYAAFMPVSLMAGSFYPVLSNFFISSIEKLQENWDRFLGMMILFAVLAAFGGLAFSDKIIYLFYGSDFLPSVFALKILTIIMSIGFISYPYNMLLVISDQQKKNFWALMTGAILNIILDLILIPKYGIFGALFSVLISCLFCFFITLIISKKNCKIKLFDKNLAKKTAIATISGFLMFLIFSRTFISGLNILILAPLGLAFYIFLVFIFSKIWKVVIL